MTDAKQTKCPHCGSTFRISDAQLAAKGGSVRCGSCLQVFRADQHLAGVAPTPVATSTPKTKTKGNADESWALDLIGEQDATKTAADGDDSFGFSDDEVDAFIETKPTTVVPQASKGIRFDDDLNELLDEPGEDWGGMPDAERTDVISESADESWAKDILSELAHEEKQDKNKYSMELIDDKKKGPKNPKLAAALGHASEAGEDVFAALGRATPAASRRTVETRPSDDFLSDDADVLGFLDEDDLSSSPTSAPTAAPAAATNPFSLNRPLAHVDAPVVLKTHRQPIDWGRLLTWTFLCLVAIGMFAAQYVYFNFDTLAITPSTRPLFEKACAQLGCRLPDIPDPTRLKIKELVVRKHPKEAGALQVDAILKNEAPFAQPFPALQLRFTNQQDEVVASRVLRPGEYLAGDAVFLRRMPPETPIRISLSIVDPGKEAVNYSLNPLF